MRGRGDDVERQALKWLGSYTKCRRWMQRYEGIDETLEEHGGLVKFDDFLPPFVAEGILHLLSRISDDEWNNTAAVEDYTHNNIAHEFWSTKAAGQSGGELGAVFRALSLLLPGQLNTFSAGRYDRGHHIAPHDDRAYTSVRLDTGQVITASRDVTLVYYLTKSWSQALGGCFVDLEARDAPGGQRTYVPQFNSAVVFRVPRYHSVTPVKTDRPRYSIFGWFLQPGKLYTLFTGEDEEEQPQGGQLELELEKGGSEEEGDQELGSSGRGSSEEEGEGCGGTREQGRRQAANGSQQPAAWCKLAQRILSNRAAAETRRESQGAASKKRKLRGD